MAESKNALKAAEIESKINTVRKSMPDQAPTNFIPQIGLLIDRSQTGVIVAKFLDQLLAEVLLQIGQDASNAVDVAIAEGTVVEVAVIDVRTLRGSR